MTVRPLLIALRELRSYFADLGALAFSLALPLVLLALMLGAFGGSTEFSGTAYVVDNDGGPYAQALLDELRAIDGLSVEILDAEEAADRIDRSAILYYTEIPEGFSAGLENGQPVDLRQYQRGGGGQEGQIVSSMVREALLSVTAGQDLRASVVALAGQLEIDAPPEAVDSLVAQTAENLNENPPVTVETAGPGEEESTDLAATLFPRIAAWMVLFAVTLSAQAFIQEQKAGTLERLLTTRLTRNELFIGKWLANFLRGFVQFLILFVIGALIFDFFTLGSWVNAVTFGVVAIAAVASLGLVIATLARTENQAAWGAVFFTMAVAIFGGTFFDVDADEVFGIFARITPTYWMNIGFDELLIDRNGLASIATPALALLAFAVAGIVISRVLFRPVPGGGA